MKTIWMNKNSKEKKTESKKVQPWDPSTTTFASNDFISNNYGVLVKYNNKRVDMRGLLMRNSENIYEIDEVERNTEVSTATILRSRDVPKIKLSNSSAKIKSVLMNISRSYLNYSWMIFFLKLPVKTSLVLKSNNTNILDWFLIKYAVIKLLSSSDNRAEHSIIANGSKLTQSSIYPPIHPSPIISYALWGYSHLARQNRNREKIWDRKGLFTVILKYKSN